MNTNYDVIIIGAGAAGLMCAIRAGEKGLSVLVLEKSDKIGNKISISGGGRCNFTNINTSPDAYLSANSHFCKSALSRYTPWHFIDLLEQYELSYTEKTLGQLFCDQESGAIIEMLVAEAELHGVDAILEQNVESIEYDDFYIVKSNEQTVTADNVVIACGGPSIPKLGATDFALRVAKQFNIKNIPFSPALVPFTLSAEILQTLNKDLTGVSHPIKVSCNGKSFTENMLFTHRGLSGPAMLQISSYWKKGDELSIDLFVDTNVKEKLIEAKKNRPKILLSTFLSEYMVKKLADKLCELYLGNETLQSYSDKKIEEIVNFLHNWNVMPAGTEGMKKAEVSLGGVNTDELSSKTMESTKQKGLYFIGEAVDVTGWLGGYNFQWAWASGWCCGDSLNV